MNRFNISGLFLISFFLFCSCSSLPDRSWSDAIPGKAPFVVIPSEDATLNSVLESSYTPFLDDITSSAVQLLSRVDSAASDTVRLQAIMLYPGVEKKLETVWIGRTSDKFVKVLRDQFYQRFSQNQYYFHEIEIHKLHLGDRILFAAQFHDLVLLSESSLGVEEAIRSYLGKSKSIDLSGISPQPGHILMNTPSLDLWLEQMAKVANRPLIQNVLKGTRPTLLSVGQQGKQERQEFKFSGNIALSSDKSPLVSAMSTANAPISLDRYISSNAAAFGLFRMDPPPAALDSSSQPTKLDKALLGDKGRYSKLAGTLQKEFALVMYSESGFLSTGEHLFLRRIGNEPDLREALASLEEDSLIEQSDGAYFVQSRVLGQLIGSPMCSFQNFYLNITGEALVISKRKGLVEIIASDRNRRRTIYYEQSYRNIKEQLPANLSGLFIASSEFYSFIEPFLEPDNYVNALTSKFDLLSVSTQINKSGDQLAFNLQTYKTTEARNPYEEKWLFTTGGNLSGEPVLANIGGSERDEVIFATKSGNLYTLAADGTVVMEVNTGSDQPVGSPVVYDWYATNQKVILLAAGNKIYGWNDRGELLPKFPFSLNERITTPLVIDDINRDGLPDALVATADRKLHALNGRGQNLDGWPVTTNAEINAKPVVDNFLGSLSVMAFSENAVNAWRPDGDPKSGFPKFVNASLNGSPLIYKNNILGNAADGNLYAVGPDRLFADSLNVFKANASNTNIEAIYASNSALVGTPTVQEVTVRNENRVFREPMILTMSSNGSAFLFGTAGQLRFTRSMGQPAASSFSPFISDVNLDSRMDIVALADFGRLYVWQIVNGERIYSVPTAGLNQPIVADIDGDGYNELIAQTREGLRCWTIYGSSQNESLSQ